MDRRENKRFTRLAALILALMLVPVFAVFGFAAETEEPDEQVCYVHGNLTGEVAVDAQDAIYLLYHASAENGDEYPLNQDGDFNGDGEVTAQDAIWLLYASLGILEDHELLGEVHAYTTDTWEWSEDGSEATVTLACACGNGEPVEETVEVTSESTGSCTVAGVKTYNASYTHEGVVYAARKTETVDAPGHQWKDGKAPTCEEGAVCDTCGFEQKPLGHIYNVVETAATCTDDAYETYSCKNCDLEPFRVVMEGTMQEHNWDEGELVVDGCSTKTVYTCQNDGCGFTRETDAVVSHTYTAAITQNATCVATGVKTYTCSVCKNDAVSYTEEIAVNENHTWGEGVLGEDGVTTTYTCQNEGCGQTKVSVAAKQAEVAKEDLENTSVELTDATVKMDKKTLDGIEGEAALTIQVDAVDVNTIDESLLAELPGEVANGKVYDFTMYAGEEQITEFAGEVTVSIPYTLQEGDDPDCIDVYYIKDDGSVDCYQGIYANGQVTFTTDHFSYYTVTRLSAAERCEVYGHAEETKSESATCTTAGYTLTTCQRCGEVIEKVIVPANGHAYTETKVDPTCTEGGSITKTCDVCDDQVKFDLPAVGHTWVDDEEASFAANCTEDGKDVRSCACGATYEQVLKATGHSHVLDETKTVVADCTTDGSETYVCSCGDSYTVATGKAHGHQYQETEDSWAWNENHTTATVTLYCYHDQSHTKVIPATVTKTAEDCQGNVTYTATTSYNNRNYVSTERVDTGVASHMPEAEWSGNIDSHFHICVRCGEELDTADHNYTAPVVTKAPTCANTGIATSTCTVCEYEKATVIPATGTHSFVNGVCSACGIKNDACDHNVIAETDKDVTPAGICAGSKIHTASCACGKNSVAYLDLKCNIVQESMRQVTSEDGTGYYEFTFCCTDCGLSFIYRDMHLLDKEACELWFVMGHELMMNGKVFAETNEYCELIEDHPIKSEIEIDLGELGLCGGELNVIECHCGLVGDQTDEMNTESACNWVLDRAKSTDDDNYLYYDCSVCGAVKIVESEHSGNGCIYNLDKTLTYMVDGKVVYQDTFRPITMENHVYQVESAQVHGDSCEDGISFVQRCADCGKTQEVYSRSHVYTESNITDISQFGFCDNYLVEQICACGKATWCYTYNDEGNNCDIYWVDGDEERQVWACNNCSLTYEETCSYGEKDEYCMCDAVRIKTYSKGMTEQAFTVREKIRAERHDMQTTTNLLGKTCEDGVEWSNTCADCGFSTKAVSYEHALDEVDTIDLAALGFCDGTVEHYACACGKYSHLWNSGDACSWGYNWITDDDGNQHQLMGCEICGNSLDWCYSNRVTDGCDYTEYVEVTVFVDDVKKDSLAAVVTGENHKTVTTFYLQGDSCEDGYTTSHYCVECGETSTNDYVRYDHQQYTTKLEKMTDKTCLPTYYEEVSCACGQEFGSWTSSFGMDGCEYSSESVYVESIDQWIQFCDKCGIGDYSVTLNQQPTEDPCMMQVERVRYFVNRDGEYVDVYTQLGYESNHNYEVFFDMLGDTCEDGYYVSWKCRVCGAESRNSNLQTECMTWENGWTTLYDGTDTCGPIEENSWVTPCGNEQGGISYVCEFHNNDLGYYDEEIDSHVDVCSRCGVERYDTSLEVKPDTSEGAGPCDTINRIRTTLRRNGNVIATFEFTTTGRDHEPEETVTFLNGGTSCEDGYTVTEQCSRCGESFGERGPYYDHNPDELWQGWDLSEYGLCGEENVSRWSCACGRHASGGWGGPDDCQWQYVSESDVTGGVMYKEYCPNCNTYRYSLHEDWTDDTQNCTRSKTFYHRYERDGEELLTIEFEEYSDGHELVFDHFDLSGDTCEDGFTVTEKCKNCDYISTSDEMNEHAVYQVEKAELSEYGMCVGTYSRYRCACGQKGWEELITNCNWQTVSTDANGVQTQQCAYCGTYRDHKHTENWVTECTCEILDYQKLYNDDGVIKEVTRTYENINHTLVVTGYHMNGDSCADGYSLTEECYYCGETREYTDMDSHNTNLLNFVDLDDVDGACGGYIAFYSCMCGEECWDQYSLNCMTEHSQEEIADEDGIIHRFDTYTCQECDLHYVRETYTVPTGNGCDAIGHTSFAFYYGQQLLTSFAMEQESNVHAFGATQWSLMEDAENCDDGLIGIATCSKCGETNEYHQYGHRYEFVEDIDFGATCSTVLRHTKCICGEAEQYYLFGENGCDWNSVTLDEIWIEDAITDPYQYNSEGTSHYFTENEVLTCAVTDPACGIVVRRARYWKAEDNCVADMYETWQLDYDAATDTCAREITYKIYDNYVLQYHDYAVETAIEKLDADTEKHTATYTCRDCGSTVVEVNHFLGNDQVYNQLTATNNQGNRNSSYERIQEYGHLVNGDYHQTRYYSKNTYSDGSAYWSETVYTYDGCVRTYVTTDSEGQSYTGSSEHFLGGFGFEEYLVEPSCTQYGVKTWGYKCPICDEQSESHEEIVEPLDHDWCNNGTHYECNRCHLTNLNGTSGAIVLEDMTDYDNGTEYVIGFWNPNNMYFDVRAYIMTADANGELVLAHPDALATGFTIENEANNGRNAITTDKSILNIFNSVAQQNGYDPNECILRISLEAGLNASGEMIAYSIDVDKFAN